MGVVHSNKEVSDTKIRCGETFRVTLSLTASPDIESHPTDIVLLLDRSGSMAGSPLDHLKLGAKKFISILDEATDGAHDGHIGFGSRIGIVSFATTATQNTPLITSVEELNEAVEALSAGGSTNHADAFTHAMQLFDETSTNAKVIVLFTDGKTTAGPPPTPIAEAAKAQGVTIYCIGLRGSKGLDDAALIAWASEPASAYVAITPNEGELEDIFADLAHNIAKPGATEIVVRDTISPCFRVQSVETPTKGTAKKVDDTSVLWEIEALGVRGSEGASLTFTVEHIGPCTGLIEVNRSVSYQDHEGNEVVFPSPKIEVRCDEPTPPECPDAVEITIGGCTDTVEYNAGDLQLDDLGRILLLDVKLKNVCPHKRVALAVILTEVDAKDEEHPRGTKTMVIPAHTGSVCRDVTVRCIRFVLPEELDVSGTPGGICNERHFLARFIAHYIDSDFTCCRTTV